MMTRRDFNALAALVADVQADIKRHNGAIGVEDLANQLADVCKASNPRFDRERFLVAALGTDGLGHYGRS
jgi:predicted secreted protein